MLSGRFRALYTPARYLTPCARIDGAQRQRIRPPAFGRRSPAPAHPIPGDFGQDFGRNMFCARLETHVESEYQPHALDVSRRSFLKLVIAAGGTAAAAGALPAVAAAAETPTA